MENDGVSTPAAHASDELDIEPDREDAQKLEESVVKEIDHAPSQEAPGVGSSRVPAAKLYMRNLISQIIPHLDSHDTTFLSDYLGVLTNNDEADIKNVTYHIMASIEDALHQRAEEPAGAPCSLGEQRTVLCAFLSAATLSEQPRVRRACPALLELLKYTTEEERVTVARVCWRVLPVSALVLLSDSVRAPRCGALHEVPSLDELLLRALLSRLSPHAPTDEPLWQLGAPTLAELEGALPTWRTPLDNEHIMLLGRVLAAAPAALRPPLLSLLADLPDPPSGDPTTPRFNRMGTATLLVLFSEDPPEESASSNAEGDSSPQRD